MLDVLKMCGNDAFIFSITFFVIFVVTFNTTVNILRTFVQN